MTSFAACRAPRCRGRSAKLRRRSRSSREAGRTFRVEVLLPLMNIGLRTRPWAGLDIGEYSIKLVALQPGVAGARHFVAEAPVVRDRESTAPSAEQLARTIDECFSRAGVTSRSIGGITL